MRWRVRLTRRAEADIEGIYDWISRHEGRPVEAGQWLDDLETAIESLSDYPFRCALAPEDAFMPQEIRQKLFFRHRILFTVQGDEVIVLHLRHERRREATPQELEEGGT